MRTLLNTSTHKIMVGDTSPEAELSFKKSTELDWCHGELGRTDKFVVVPDHPSLQAYLDYRVKLYAYPHDVGFPNNARPEL